MTSKSRVIPWITTFVLILSALVATNISSASAAPAPAMRADRDCSDFATQKAAQEYYISRGGPQRDPDGLDADGNGVACESNPCPCSTATGGGGGGGGDGSNGPNRDPRKVQKAKIIRVIDGDTVEVRLRTGGKEDVRLIGIDTPEVFGGEECYGRQASDFAKKKLPPGTRVTLISDPTQDLKDRYGRLLRYVIRDKDKVDFNKVQVARGNAKVYVFGGKRFERARSYFKAQDKAKRQNKGLWGAC